MLRKLIYKFIALIFLLPVSSCEIFNPEEQVPAYVHLDKIDLNTQSDEGSKSHKITDAWVYLDDQLVGTFELPSTFPVLTENGNHNLKIGI